MNVKQNPFFRYQIVGGMLSIVGLLIFFWMVKVQTSDSAKLIMKQANEYTYMRKTFYPERGNIYDRWGHLLAGNMEVYELGADLREINDPQTVAMTLVNVLGLD